MQLRHTTNPNILAVAFPLVLEVSVARLAKMNDHRLKRLPNSTRGIAEVVAAHIDLPFVLK